MSATNGATGSNPAFPTIAADPRINIQASTSGAVAAASAAAATETAHAAIASANTPNPLVTVLAGVNPAPSGTPQPPQSASASSDSRNNTVITVDSPSQAPSHAPVQPPPRSPSPPLYAGVGQAPAPSPSVILVTPPKAATETATTSIFSSPAISTPSPYSPNPAGFVPPSSSGHPDGSLTSPDSPTLPSPLPLSAAMANAFATGSVLTFSPLPPSTASEPASRSTGPAPASAPSSLPPSSAATADRLARRRELQRTHHVVSQAAGAVVVSPSTVSGVHVGEDFDDFADILNVTATEGEAVDAATRRVGAAAAAVAATTESPHSDVRRRPVAGASADADDELPHVDTDQFRRAEPRPAATATAGSSQHPNFGRTTGLSDPVANPDGGAGGGGGGAAATGSAYGVGMGQGTGAVAAVGSGHPAAFDNEFKVDRKYPVTPPLVTPPGRRVVSPVSEGCCSGSSWQNTLLKVVAAACFILFAAFLLMSIHKGGKPILPPPSGLPPVVPPVGSIVTGFGLLFSGAALLRNQKGPERARPGSPLVPV